MAYDQGKTPEENFGVWRKAEQEHADQQSDISLNAGRFTFHRPGAYQDHLADAMAYGFSAYHQGKRIDPREFYQTYEPEQASQDQARIDADWIRGGGYELFDQPDSIGVALNGRPFMTITVSEIQMAGCRSKEDAVSYICRAIKRQRAENLQRDMRRTAFEDWFRDIINEGERISPKERRRVPADALAKMRKVKAMLSSSFDGERENARVMLDALLAKHGLREGDID